MTPDQALLLANYNQWMNQRLYAVCAELSDDERKENRHSFFGSIHATLNHLLLADKVWMGRFQNQPFNILSLSQELHSEFQNLRNDREATDDRISRFIEGLDNEILNEDFSFTGVTVAVRRHCALWIALTHFFNHQTHHRGQLTALLSQIQLDYGVTDLLQMPGAVHSL